MWKSDILSAKTGPPNIGYHGEDGYCRNTPDLRGQQSDFDDEGNAWLYIEYIDCINNHCFTKTPPSYFTEEISKQTISSGYIKTILSDKTRLKYTYSKMFVKPPKRAQSVVPTH